MRFFLSHKLRMVMVIVCLALIVPLRAQDQAPSRALVITPQEFFRQQPPVLRRPVSVSKLPAALLQDQKDIWTGPQHLSRGALTWIIPLAGVTGLLFASDHHNMTLLHSNPRSRSESTNISNFGVGGLVIAAAGSYAVGVFTHNEHARETGVLTAEAMADSFLVSEAVKLATQRDRPPVDSARGLFWQRSSLSSSFPSQHAAIAWSAAAVFAREYPGPATKWLAYGLASLVSLTRITADSHFPSDVVIGAVAGYLVGSHVYHSHHDDRMTDRTGATPLIERADPEAPPASVYVPLDSWIYPALRRIAAFGYIPDQVAGSAPWTRLECLHEVEEAFDIATSRETRAQRPALNEYVLRLLRDLHVELNEEAASNTLKLDSLYTRFLNIRGAPLRDSYHFGQTVTDDFGRPFGQGMSNVTGFSGHATAGRFSAYLRAEYQQAPGADAYTLPVRQFIANVDGNPLAPASAVPAIHRFQTLEMYTGVQLGIENITFGKQSLWWSPDQESAFSFSNNAAPFYMLRFAQTSPLVLPGPFSRLGRIRTEIVFGKLSGHHWPARPFMNAQKISLDLTDNFEIGFTRSAFFGGVGHALTLGSFKSSLLSVTSVDYGPYGSPDLPGDRHSSFDFRWRVPGLRRFLTVYSDSYADDEPNPIDNPRRAAWAPGLYISHLPGLPRLDFTFETSSTLLYRKDYGGNFLYWDNQYHDSYTNQGNLLGSWIGRDSRVYVASASYAKSAKSYFKGQYRQIKAGTRFLPRGGTQTDATVTAQLALAPEWLLGAQVQVERYFVPLLGGARIDVLSSLQLTFSPKKWLLSK